MTQAREQRQFFKRAFHGVLLGMVVACSTTPVLGQELSAREGKNVEQVKSLITKAGLDFKNEDFRASAKVIANVQKKLARFAKGADGEYLKLLQSQHDRMAKAHEMLVAKGQKLKEVEPLPVASDGGDEASSGTSFVSVVAPIVNAKCGRCHVAQSRGQFSARDYNTLMNSTTVTEGEPDVSRLIEVIEDGSMPKGDLKVTETELASLKAWIAEGAKFDGKDQNQPIAEFGGEEQSASATPRIRMDAIRKPTGNETVTFGAHVAPVLVENCGQCHMSRNPRGGFNMSQFRTFIRGGDSGAPVQAGNSANSTLIKRLRGEGGDVMPPTGKLDDATIAKIAKWIDEGAKFDPVDASLSMQALAAKGTSALLSHDELVASRRKEADRIWKLVMTDTEADAVETDMFILRGTPTEDGLQPIAEMAEKLTGKIARQLGTESREHFIRGNGSIFVVTRRYDFGEFGKMLLRREFPRALKGYWSHNGTIAFSTLLKSRNQSAADLEVLLTQQLASMHVADLSAGTPRWFSDGMGFRVAAELYRKDPVVQAWEKNAVAAANSMTRIDDFLKNRLDEDKSGLVSFLFVGQLKSDKGRFKKLMNGLKSGENFDAAFSKVYGGTPEQLFERYSKGGGW